MDIDIRRCRVDLGLSQFRLASLAGVSRFNLSLAERGEHSLTPLELACVKEALRREASRIQGIAADVIGQEVA